MQLPFGFIMLRLFLFIYIIDNQLFINMAQGLLGVRH